MTSVSRKKVRPRTNGAKRAGLVLIPILVLLVLLAAGFSTLAAPEGQHVPGGDGRQRLTAPQDTSALPYQSSGTLDQKTYISTGDATIKEGYPITNFGSVADLWAGYDDHLEPDGKIFRGLVRFNPNTLPPGANITKGTLRLYMVESWDYPGRNRAIQAHDVTGSWTEYGVIWNNRPGYGTGYGFVNILPDDFGWREFDVTNLVKDWHSGAKPNNGIMIRGPEASGTDSSWRAFSTREGDDPPQLVVEYSAPINTPPKLSSLPAQYVPKDGSKNQAVDLWAHATDQEDPDVALTFSFANTPAPQAGVSLSGNRYININPATGWTGQTDVVVQIRDSGGLTDQKSFQVTIGQPGDQLVFMPLVVRDSCGFAPYFDDFSDPGSGWATGSNASFQYGYLNGEYQVKIKTTENQFVVTPDLVLPADYVVEVDARQTTAKESALGMMFGVRFAPPAYEGYQFVVFPHRREFLLEKRLMDGSWQILVDSLYHSAILPGTATNRLRVERTGTAIKLFVNGTHVWTKQDASFTGPGRDAGVRVYSYDEAPVDGRFDNFRAVCP